MTLETSKSNDVAQIRNLIHQWAEAVRTKDSAALASHMAPDVLLFDLVTPLRYCGSDALKERVVAWLASFQGALGYEIRNLSITAGQDVAFCHSLNRVVGRDKDGQDIDMWWRATICFRKIDGDWMVVHEHSSVPFDSASGLASLDLKP